MELNITYNENCRTGLLQLPDACVDCIITSPPYWALRDYGVHGQLGQEATPEAYLRSLLSIFCEIYRVLKPYGTCFVNIGDTYAGSGAGTTKNANISTYIKQSKQVYILPKGTAKSAALRKSTRNKSLLMIPYRFAWLMIKEQKWILRNIINWHKPNQMPTSVKDRFTVDFEPVLFFTKSSKYYFSQLFEPIKDDSIRRAQSGWHGKVMSNGKGAAGIGWMDREGERFANSRGRNMRTTWSISTRGFRGAHFAVYPEKLAERMLLAGCPEGGVVLDPFMGSGTTAVVAVKNNRHFIGYELNKEYIAMQNSRLSAIVH